MVTLLPLVLRLQQSVLHDAHKQVIYCALSVAGFHDLSQVQKITRNGYICILESTNLSPLY